MLQKTPPPPPDQSGVTYDVLSDKGYILVTDTAEPDQPQWKIPIRRAPTRTAPGLIRKAANFGKAIADHAAAGFVAATDQQVDERFAICEACPSKLYELKVYQGDVPVGTCNDQKCGCVIAPSGYQGKSKLRWAEQSCPKSHWKAIE